MLPLFFAAFFCFGLVLVLVGANQAELARDLDLDLTRSGLLGSALALGLGVGVVGAGPLFDRWSRRPLFVGSALLAALGLLGASEGMSFERAFVLIAIVGVGGGAYDTLINAVVVEIHQERSTRPMAAVHAGATLGAMLGPPLFGWFASHHHWSAGFHWAGVAHLVLAACALAMPLPAPHPRSDLAGPDPSVFSAALVPFACVAFAYVGLESCMTIFAVPYASDALELDPARGRTAISAFWLGLFVGRLALLPLRFAIDARVLVAAGVLAAGVLAVGVASGVAQVELFFAAVGLALGSVYPVMISLVGLRFPWARGTAAGLAAGAGAVGGFAVPWLTGAIGDGLGVTPALASMAVWSAAIALAGRSARRLRSPGAHP